MAAILYKWLVVSLLSVGFLKPATEKHPFFVSVTEINHNAKDKALEVTCKIFVDDMEGALKQNYKVAVDLSDKTKEAQHNQLITAYIQNHLFLSADGKRVPLQYVGFERDGESVFCYFEGQNIASLKKMDIANSLLQDFTDKQINIIHATVNGKRQSTKLDYPHKEASFSWPPSDFPR